jgi:hypothetical protein
MEQCLGVEFIIMSDSLRNSGRQEHATQSNGQPTGWPRRVLLLRSQHNITKTMTIKTMTITNLMVAIRQSPSKDRQAEAETWFQWGRKNLDVKNSFFAQ